MQKYRFAIYEEIGCFAQVWDYGLSSVLLMPMPILLPLASLTLYSRTYVKMCLTCITDSSQQHSFGCTSSVTESEDTIENPTTPRTSTVTCTLGYLHLAWSTVFWHCLSRLPSSWSPVYGAGTTILFGLGGEQLTLTQRPFSRPPPKNGNCRAHGFWSSWGSLNGHVRSPPLYSSLCSAWQSKNALNTGTSFGRFWSLSG